MRFFKFLSILVLLSTIILGVTEAQKSNRRKKNNQERINLTRVKWAHAVNSRKELQDALNSDVDMLEADVLVGKLTTSSEGEDTVIMAHPPAQISDLSLDEFLDAAFSQSTKGIKLDFKIPQVVPVALKKIADRSSLIKIPIWLNADILQGPVNASSAFFNPRKFLQQCKSVPKSVVSVGWTTRFGPDIRNPFNIIKEGSYSREDVLRMREVLVAEDVKQKVTFPVRAGLVASEESHTNLLWLLDEVPQSTLTIWGSQYDTVNIKGLVSLISKVGNHRVYLDLPPGDDCQVKHFRSSGPARSRKSPPRGRKASSGRN